MRLLPVLAVPLALAATVLASGPKPAAETRWLAVGDSITQAGLYARYLELFEITRHPDRPFTLVNAGISGDTAAGGLRRLDWDILPTSAPAPTVASVMFGMNDCGRDLYAPGAADSPENAAKRRDRLDTYERNLRELARRLQARGTRVVLITPSPLDDTAALDTPNLPGANAALADAATRVRAIARDLDLDVVDFHGPLTALNHRLQAADPSATVIGRDRVHPGSPGHLAMAYLLLRTQEPPAPVAAVHLHAGHGAVRATSPGVTIKDLSATPKAVRFSYLAPSLPFPVPAEAQPAIAWVPLAGEFNREELRVTDLAPGRYRLSIDGAEVGEFSAEDFARGLDLAALPTPQRKQAEAVLALLERRWAAQAKLRVLAETEHHRGASLPRPVTHAAMEPLLTKWEAELAVKPTWQSKYPANYRAWKPQAAAIAAEAESLLAEARTAARPMSRVVEISPAAAPR